MNASKKNADVEVFTLEGEIGCELDVVGVRGDLCLPREERCVPVIEAWLENCERNHPACVGGRAELPTRVIDVGVDGEEYVKLFVGEKECARYIALSHCWWYVKRQSCCDIG